jgi:hypothetical protein
MRLRQTPALTVVFIAALLSIHGHAQSAPPSANAYTQQMNPTTVYGAGASIDFLALQAGNNTGAVYIQFSLAGIPANASVQKATLQLYVNQVLGPGSFDVYQLNSEWNQSTLTFSNAPILGASATGNQPVAIPASAYQFVLIDVTPLVQDWVSGAIPNNGLALAMTTSTGGVLFDSKEATQTSHMPELQIVLNGPAAGAAGPNTVSTTTASAIAGIIKGSGGALAPAIPGTDYVTPGGNITGNAGTATQLSSTGPNGTFWGVFGGVQGYYQPSVVQGLSVQANVAGGNCQAITAANSTAAVNWATSSCAVITADGSNVSSITLSNPSSGQAYSLGLCNDGSPRIWALPGTLKQASIPQYSSECVYKIYTFDGANYQGPGSTANPTVIYGTERSAPAPAAQGAFVCWWDNSTHLMTCDDNGGSTANMVVPVAGANNGQFVSYIDSSGIQHMGQAGAGSGSGTVTTTGSPASGSLAKFSGSTSITGAGFSDVVAMWAGCSGTQYLGADGSCHLAAGSGTVTSSGAPSPGNMTKFSSATNIVPAAASDVVKLFSSCSGSQYLGADSACHSVAGSGVADLPVGTAYSATPATGSSDTVTCGKANGTFVAFSTTISRPPFTQIAGSIWQLGISAIETSSASALTFSFQIKDNGNVVYTSGAQGDTVSGTNFPDGAEIDEQISGSDLGSAALTVYPVGSVFSNYGQSALNHMAQIRGYASNNPATIQVLMQCSAGTAGNSVTLLGLTETKIY